MNTKHQIILLIILFQISGCAYKKYSPSLMEIDDHHLVKALCQSTIKFAPSNDHEFKQLITLFKNSIYQSKLFREIKSSDQISDLEITNYESSKFKRVDGFFNEGLAFMSLFGYVITYEEQVTYEFAIRSTLSGKSVNFGPLTYKSKTLAGWFFAPFGIFKKWQNAKTTLSEDEFNKPYRSLWLNIFSTKKRELLNLIENI